MYSRKKNTIWVITPPPPPPSLNVRFSVKKPSPVVNKSYTALLLAKHNKINWDTSCCFFADKNIHKSAAVITSSAGKQVDEDKPAINEQSALDDTTMLDDDPISSGKSAFCSFYW